MTPHGLNTAGTSQENTQCTSRIHSGPDAASPAAHLLLAHSPTLPQISSLKTSLFHVCCPVHPGGMCSEPPTPRTPPKLSPSPPSLRGPTSLRRRTVLEPSPWCWQSLVRKGGGGRRGGDGKNVEAGGCNHPSCCLFPQTNSRAIRVGEFNQRLSFPGTISPNENLIFFYRTLLH